MKTYTKTHGNKKAAEIHIKKIKQRGGITQTKTVKAGIQIDYYFSNKEVNAAKQTKNPSDKAVAKHAGISMEEYRKLHPGTKKELTDNANRPKSLPKKKSTVKPKKKKYDIISPDGFSIRIGVPPFKSIEERDLYFEKWKKRYEMQGYYSSVDYGRIPLIDLHRYCEWLEL